MMGMDESEPPENPFGGAFPFFGDLSKILGGAGGGWDGARQLAVTMANQGESEPNVDPSTRIEIEQLARVAELHVVKATGLSPASGSVDVSVVTRAQWAAKALEAYKPLFERLSASLSQPPESPGDELDTSEFGGANPMAAVFEQMMAMMGPMLLSMTAGSMIGHLARRSLATYDIPIPRDSNEVLIVAANLDDFGDEWSLPSQDLRLWVCLHDITHSLVLSVPHVADTLTRMLLDYASGFRPDAGALQQQLEGLNLNDPSALEDLQSTLGNPEAILGAIQTSEQAAMAPRLEALTAVIVGYVDHIMDGIGENLIGTYGQLSEALRRRRVEADPSDRFIERMLGLELTQAQYDRGLAFVEGVHERAGEDGLAKLWESERNLPTPNEVDAPGLWLARIELPEPGTDPQE